ncbi:MAG: hypothetical protein IKU39_04870 [Lachnospiraceae bacterium]|nr:hypothetical protein [Lachnospiraceae bacterium]
MDAIVKMYGNFILEGIAVICLTLFLFGDSNTEHSGMIELMGDKIAIEEKDYGAYIDFREIYKEESAKSAPIIEYVNGVQKTGTIDLSQVISAVDYAGNKLPIVILSVKSMDGEELIEHYNSDTSEIVLERAGIYTIEVKAMDDGNRMSWCRIKIPVNGRVMEENN